MSVQAEVDNLDALTQALGDARNDGEGVNRKSWVLVGHVNNNPNQIQLVGQVSAWSVAFFSLVQNFLNMLQELSMVK